jgi:Domain of unknown function (DUF4382)/Putative Ig domain
MLATIRIKYYPLKSPDIFWFPPLLLSERKQYLTNRRLNMKKTALYLSFAGFAIAAMLLAGCAVLSTATTPGGNTLTTLPTSAAKIGSIEIRVTDAPPSQDVTSVMVTVASVQIHLAGNSTTSTTTTTTTTTTATTTTSTSTTTSTPTESDSGWITLNLSGPSTFDLLKVKGLEQVLAVGDLAPGQYTQIRMQVSKAQVAISGGQLQDATIPSGELKFVHPFNVVAGKATVILCDFDAAHSINITGNGKIMFKPVVKLAVTDTPGSLEITTPSLDNGEVGSAYNMTVNAIGGSAPYTWSIVSGSLPDGLSLDAATGVISGTPTTPGSLSLTLKAVDAITTDQKTSTKNFSINIAAAGALQIINTSLPDGVNGAVYSSTTIQGVGGTATYNWSISAGNLPAGLALNAATGEISGTPIASGDFSFTIKVTDSASPANADTQNLTLTISPDPTE